MTIEKTLSIRSGDGTCKRSFAIFGAENPNSSSDSLPSTVCMFENDIYVLLITNKLIQSINLPLITFTYIIIYYHK